MENKEIKQTPEQVVENLTVDTKVESKEVKSSQETPVVETEIKKEKVEVKEEAKKEQKKSPFSKPFMEARNLKADPLPKNEKEIKKEVAKEIAESSDKKEFRVGMKVKIKDTTKEEVTGRPIPFFAYKNIYKVSKILPNRILINVDSLTLAVTENDIAEA